MANTKCLSIHLPIELVERIRAEARARSCRELRRVTITEVAWRALDAACETKASAASEAV